MDANIRASADLVEAGYWLSQPVFWSVALILMGLCVAALLCLIRYRRVIKENQYLVQNLRESTDSFRYLVETAHEGIAVVQNKRLVYFNPRMCEMSGYNEAELKALPSFMPLIDPSARDEMLANHLRRLAGEAAPQRYESLFLRKDGISYPIELSGVAIVWQGQPATLNMLTDISERKAAEKKTQYLAHHDSLTGLPNRLALRERLKQTLSLAERSKIPFAVLFIDLNQFKQINDTYGHDVGDALLQQVAKRIEQQLRETDTLARIGGDEFVVLLTQVTDRQGVKKSMARIEAAMAQPFQAQHHTLQCHVSQGAALFPDDGASTQALLSVADKNMYVDKRRYYQRQAEKDNQG